VKEISRLDKDERFKKLSTVGGVMEGEKLTAARVAEISKWPSRAEQLSLLVGQILAPGSQLAAQIIGPGGRLAGQIEQIGKAGGD
jgi:ribosomal protein L10